MGVLWLFLPMEFDSEFLSSLVDYRPPPGELTLLSARPWLGQAAGFGYWSLDESVMQLPLQPGRDHDSK